MASTGGPGSFAKRWGLCAALAVAFLFWLVQFRGVVLGGQNLMGYRLVDPRITGSEPLPTKRKPNKELPGGDASLLLTHVPYQSFLARSLPQTGLPLWNPEMGCGQPVASDPQYKPFNPFFWFYFARPTAWVFSLSIALMALFGMWGAILFFREAGLAWPAAAVGGLLAAFNALTQQMLVLSSAWGCWAFFWGLWGAERWRQGKPGGLALAVAASALTLYAGHPVISALYLAVLLCYGAFAAQGRSWRDRAAFCGAVACGAAVLHAAQILPFLADSGVQAHYKAAWDGGPYHQWWLLSDPKSLIYVPMPVWGLASAGLASGENRLRLFFSALVAYGVLLMFPWIGPGGLRWALSLGGVLVARYGQETFQLGLMGLGALGVHALARSWSARGRWDAARHFAYGAAGFWVLAWATSEVRFSVMWPSVYKRQTLLECVACLPPLLVPLLPRRKGWTYGACAGLLFAAWLPAFLPTALSRYLSSEDLTARPPAVVREILGRSASGSRDRISGSSYPKDGLADLCPNQNLLWGLADIRLTSPICLESYWEFSQHWESAKKFPTTHHFPRQTPELLRFLGVRWNVTDAARPMPGLPVLAEAPPLALQEVTDARPWVRAVGEWEFAGTRTEALKRTFELLRSGKWEGRAVLEPGTATPPRAEEGWEAPEIRWVKSGPDEWRWEVRGSRPSLLLVLQNAHPGWRARIDGRPAPVFRAYGTFMAVPVDAGAHAVDLEFGDALFSAGLLLTAGGWLAWVALLLRGLVRRRKGRGTPSCEAAP